MEGGPIPTFVGSEGETVFTLYEMRTRLRTEVEFFQSVQAGESGQSPVRLCEETLMW